MVPFMPLIPKTVTTLPKANGYIFDGQYCQRILKLTVVLRFSLIPVGLAGDTSQFARLTVT